MALALGATPIRGWAISPTLCVLTPAFGTYMLPEPEKNDLIRLVIVPAVQLGLHESNLYSWRNLARFIIQKFSFENATAHQRLAIGLYPSY